MLDFSTEVEILPNADSLETIRDAVAYAFPEIKSEIEVDLLDRPMEQIIIPEGGESVVQTRYLLVYDEDELRFY